MGAANSFLGAANIAYCTEMEEKCKMFYKKQTLEKVLACFVRELLHVFNLFNSFYKAKFQNRKIRLSVTLSFAMVKLQFEESWMSWMNFTD